MDNERGNRLIEFCREKNFTVMHTWFRNHPKRYWKRKSQGDRTRNLIDFMLFQKQF